MSVTRHSMDGFYMRATLITPTHLSIKCWSFCMVRMFSPVHVMTLDIFVLTNSSHIALHLLVFLNKHNEGYNGFSNSFFLFFFRASNIQIEVTATLNSDLLINEMQFHALKEPVQRTTDANGKEIIPLILQEQDFYFCYFLFEKKSIYKFGQCCILNGTSSVQIDTTQLTSGLRGVLMSEKTSANRTEKKIFQALPLPLPSYVINFNL